MHDPWPAIRQAQDRGAHQLALHSYEYTDKGASLQPQLPCRSATRMTDVPTTRVAACSGGLRGRARNDAGWLIYHHMEN